RIFQFNSGQHLEELIKANMTTGATVVVVFGSALALIALIGFLGACCENSMLLNVYGFIVLAILVLQCVGIYFGYRYQNEYYDKFSEVRFGLDLKGRQAARDYQLFKAIFMEKPQALAFAH